MDRHLLIVANGFRAVGFLLGIPSLLACLWITWTLLQFAKPDKSAESGFEAINLGRDGIVGMIAVGATAAFKSLELLGSAAAWALRVIDVAAATLTLAGAGFYLAGRGLFLHSGWARIAAGFTAFLILMVSFLAMTSLRRGPNFFAVIPVGVSIYTLWVLIRRFH